MKFCEDLDYMATAKIKKPPQWLKSIILIKLYQSKFGVVLSNWLTQCMLYAEFTEVLFRLTLELVVFLILLAITLAFSEFRFSTALVVLIISHTVTFFINGQFFVLGRFLGIVQNKPKYFIEYSEKIRENLKNKKSIMALVMFGSLSREKFSSSSDLDIRVISKDCFSDAFISCFWTFIERFRALINKYPLDIYVVTKNNGLEKLRDDEPPIILFDKEAFISNHYKQFYEYDRFKQMFLEKYNNK